MLKYSVQLLMRALLFLGFEIVGVFIYKILIMTKGVWISCGTSCQVFTWASFTLLINIPVSISVISEAGRNLCSHLAQYQLVCANTNQYFLSLLLTVLLKFLIKPTKNKIRVII